MCFCLSVFLGSSWVEAPENIGGSVLMGVVFCFCFSFLLLVPPAFLFIFLFLVGCVGSKADAKDESWCARQAGWWRRLSLLALDTFIVARLFEWE
jgi:hypothetical protein